MIAKLLMMRCITNLHVGNGDVNYNIIDNEVERDPVTNNPTINSSGIKGAFREYFERNGVRDRDIITLFGGNEQGQEKGSVPGAIKFMQADLLAMPVRASKGSEPYYLVAPESSIKLLEEKIQMIESNNLKLEEQKADSFAAVEDIALDKKIKIMENAIYIVSDDSYRTISLPVMARNKLDNGKSVNLWYEEVVPHHSLFTFYVLADDEQRLSQFLNVVNDKIVQFGASATIGYGFCKIEEFKGD